MSLEAKPITTQEKLVTVDEFEAFIVAPEHKEFYYELINGEIVEKVPTQKHGQIAALMIAKIYTYRKEHPLGRVYVEARYRMPEDNYKSRQPDISFVADITRPIVDRGAAFYTPDLAIEIQLPDQSVRQMREKADYYLANGAKLVWLLFPEKHIINTYSAKIQDILTLEDTLDGGDVLPGFSLAVKAIFGE